MTAWRDAPRIPRHQPWWVRAIRGALLLVLAAGLLGLGVALLLL